MRTILTAKVDFDHLADSPEFAEFTAILKKLTGVVMALNEPRTGIIRWKFEESELNPVCRLIRADRVGLRRAREFVEREFRNPSLAPGHARAFPILLVWCLTVGWCFAARVLRLPRGASDAHTRSGL